MGYDDPLNPLPHGCPTPVVTMLATMKTLLQLDYPAKLANTAQPVHLALTSDAPELTGPVPNQWRLSP